MKRGRPSVMSEGEYKILKTMYSEIRTRRGILNKYWELRAFKVIYEMCNEGGGVRLPA